MSADSRIHSVIGNIRWLAILNSQNIANIRTALRFEIWHCEEYSMDLLTHSILICKLFERNKRLQNLISPLTRFLVRWWINKVRRIWNRFGINPTTVVPVGSRAFIINRSTHKLRFNYPPLYRRQKPFTGSLERCSGNDGAKLPSPFSRRAPRVGTRRRGSFYDGSPISRCFT